MPDTFLKENVAYQNQEMEKVPGFLKRRYSSDETKNPLSNEISNHTISQDQPNPIERSLKRLRVRDTLESNADSDQETFPANSPRNDHWIPEVPDRDYTNINRLLRELHFMRRMRNSHQELIHQHNKLNQSNHKP